MAVRGAGHTGRRNCDCVERGGQGELDGPHSLSTERQPPRTLPPPSGCGKFRRQDVGPLGCSPILGREWAGTRHAPAVVTADGFAARRGWATGGTDSRPATRRQRGMVSGGRCGGNPPAQGRAEGPTAQRQRLGARGQGSEATALSLNGDANWLWVGRYRGVGKFTPNLGCAHSFFAIVHMKSLCYNGPTLSKII